MRKNVFTILLLGCLLSISGFAADETLVDGVSGSIAEVSSSIVCISNISKTKQNEGIGFGLSFDSPESDNFEVFFEQSGASFFEQGRRIQVLGSGIIIDDEGYILTTNRVVSKAGSLKVKLPDGRELEAEVKGKDEVSGLGVIKIEAEDLTAASLGDSDGLNIGDWVIALGNPFGFVSPRARLIASVGIISSFKDYVPAKPGGSENTDLIQTDAAVNPGHIGGALVNLKGEVIGINTAFLTPEVNFTGGGIAIPINKAKQILDTLIRGEEISYGWLGINIQDLNEELRNYFGIKQKEGVIILKVYKNSPAQASGLKEGDLIVEFGGNLVKNARDLARKVASLPPGSEAPLVVIRQGEENDLTVSVGNTTQASKDYTLEDEPIDFLGMKVTELTPKLAKKYGIDSRKGLLILEVLKDSAAAATGIESGDVILKVDKTDVKNKNDLISVISEGKEGFLVKTNRGYFVLRIGTSKDKAPAED